MWHESYLNAFWLKAPSVPPSLLGTHPLLPCMEWQPVVSLEPSILSHPSRPAQSPAEDMKGEKLRNEMSSTWGHTTEVSGRKNKNLCFSDLEWSKANPFISERQRSPILFLMPQPKLHSSRQSVFFPTEEEKWDLFSFSARLDAAHFSKGSKVNE